jgi:hypothetical protein
MDAEDYQTESTEQALREAERRAAICRKFIALTKAGMSMRKAAAELRCPVTWFSGSDCFLERFYRDSSAGLEPRQRDTCAMVRFSVPDWFVPAAKFFYLVSNLRRHGGSVPEAVRRVINLPNLPHGWNNALKKRFLKYLRMKSLPECPADLRAIIQGREQSGQKVVPERIARKIAQPASVIEHIRSPHAWALKTLSAPGSQRRYFNAKIGSRQIMQPGDWFGGDDSTPGIAVCVPCNEVITPCSQKFGCLIGRFQWLVFHDCRTDKILAWDYVVRPRGSYRAEDILNGMGTVTKSNGIPRIGWQFEGGIWNCNIIRNAIEMMKCEHWRTYSPHQKAVESIFNRVWTRLSVQFPHADMGRYRNENEANCKLYEACKKGHQDPRKYFPSLHVLVQIFEDEVKYHNTKLIKSRQYGQWVPGEFFDDSVKTAPLLPFSPDMEWVFSPFAVERKIVGMMVKVRVPMYEDFSVPFEFSAPWMPEHRGKRVRVHFNPSEPECRAKIVLLERSGEHQSGAILGDAELIGETAGHIRMIMDWAQDDQRAGYISRQKVANYMHRATRGFGMDSRITYSAEERRDGIGTVVKVERYKGAEQAAEVPPCPPVPAPATPQPFNAPIQIGYKGVGKIARLPSAIRAEVNQRLQQNQSHKTIITWLHSLPEVQEVLKREFDGRSIKPENISHYRKHTLAPAKKRVSAVEDFRALRQKQIEDLAKFEETHKLLFAAL